MGCCGAIFGCVKGGVNCVAKTVLMSLNGFFAVQGLTITVIGIIALIATDTLEINSTKGFLVSTICFGAAILITCVLGCCGACFKNKCMLIVYMILLVCLIIGQIVLVSMAGGIKNDAKDEWEVKLTEYDPKDNNTMAAIDKYQRENSCCGVNNITDYQNNPFLSKTGSVPDSCCMEPSFNCGQGYFTPDHTHSPDEKINVNGCIEDIGLWGEIVWGVMISVIIIQAVLVVLAGCLSWKTGGD